MRIGDIESYVEQVFDSWTQSSYEIKVCVVSHFKPLGLRCEMIVIPLYQNLGSDTLSFS